MEEIALRGDECVLEQGVTWDLTARYLETQGITKIAAYFNSDLSSFARSLNSENKQARLNVARPV
jgi:hypothetical protein